MPRIQHPEAREPAQISAEKFNKTKPKQRKPNKPVSHQTNQNLVMRNCQGLRQLQMPKNWHGNSRPETNEPTHIPAERTSEAKHEQQKPNKTSKPASRPEYCQATRSATMKPATAKGAGDKCEASK